VRHPRWNEDDIARFDRPLDTTPDAFVDDRTAGHQSRRATLDDVELDDALVKAGHFRANLVARVQTVGASLQESRRGALQRLHVGKLCLQCPEREVERPVRWRLMAYEGATTPTAASLGERDDCAQDK